MKEIISFIGLSKNVGKTTFLNKYIQNQKNYLLTSIGWDGEAIDHLFGIKKPSILIKKTNFICTYSNLKPTNSQKITELPINNQFLGKLEIYQMNEDDIVQIAGPSSIKQLKIMLEKSSTLPIEQVIIDGAADRRISLAISTTVYFIIGPTFSNNKEKIIKTIQGIIKLFEIPTTQNLINHNNIVNLPSLNNANKNSLEKDKYYILENPGKIILDYEIIPKLLENYKIFFQFKPANFYIVVNSFNADLMKNTLNTSEILNTFNHKNLIPMEIQKL